MSGNGAAGSSSVGVASLESLGLLSCSSLSFDHIHVRRLLGAIRLGRRIVRVVVVVVSVRCEVIRWSKRACATGEFGERVP